MIIKSLFPVITSSWNGSFAFTPAFVYKSSYSLSIPNGTITAALWICPLKIILLSGIVASSINAFSTIPTSLSGSFPISFDFPPKVLAVYFSFVF